MNAITTAIEINDAHRLARQHAESAVQHAIRCGELLAAKKAELRHGEFKPWIAANCEFSYSSAKAYMRAVEQKDSALTFSSLREALGYDKPERAAEEPAEHISIIGIADNSICDNNPTHIRKAVRAAELPLYLLGRMKSHQIPRHVFFTQGRDGEQAYVQPSASDAGGADVLVLRCGPRGWRDFYPKWTASPISLERAAGFVQGWFLPEWWDVRYVAKDAIGATRECIDKMMAIERGEYPREVPA